MKFKPPGFELSFFTGIWILSFPLSIYLWTAGREIPWYVYAAIVVAVPAAAMWFQIRQAGYFFGVLNALLGLIGILGLFTSNFAPGHIIRVALNFYIAWLSINWARSKNEYNAEYSD